MNIKLSAYEYLDDYIEILEKYNFSPILYSDHDFIISGTIEISHLSELFDLAESIRKHFNSQKLKEDLLLITYIENELTIEICDEDLE